VTPRHRFLSGILAGSSLGLSLLGGVSCKRDQEPAPASGAPAGKAPAEAPAGGPASLTAVRWSGSGPILDVNAPGWQQAPALPVAMMPQMMATPMNPAPAVSELTVRAAHNGQWIAVLITWADSTRSDRIVTGQFGDQVAVEFPITGKDGAVPSPTMGNPGGRVNILQWRAALQHDLDRGDPTVRGLYPNAVADYYPDRVLPASSARPYSAAVGLGNPVSRASGSPVLDQVAEGFGSLTAKTRRHADGRGAWSNGRWSVVVTLPLVADSTDSPRLAPGQKTMVAFAVWEGGHREVGSRKAWSTWVPLVLGK